MRIAQRHWLFLLNAHHLGAVGSRPLLSCDSCHGLMIEPRLRITFSALADVQYAFATGTRHAVATRLDRTCDFLCSSSGLQYSTFNRNTHNFFDFLVLCQSVRCCPRIVQLLQSAHFSPQFQRSRPDKIGLVPTNNEINVETAREKKAVYLPLRCVFECSTLPSPPSFKNQVGGHCT